MEGNWWEKATSGTHLSIPRFPIPFVVTYSSECWRSGSVQYRSDEEGENFWVEPSGVCHDNSKLRC